MIFTQMQALCSLSKILHSEHITYFELEAIEYVTFSMFHAICVMVISINQVIETFGYNDFL